MRFKKTFSFFLATILLITTLPIGNLIASADVTNEYYTYAVINNTATITDVSTSINGDITVPSELGGYRVTAIGDYAFEDCKYLSSIKIPESVTSIGRYAFDSCTGITNIKLPDSIINIGNSAFYNCTGLEEIKIPNGVTNIGSQMFKNCYNLTSIILPNSITNIDNTAFHDCRSLNYNIYDNGKYLGNENNLYLVLIEAVNTDITEFDFPDGLKIIFYTALYNCTNLTSLKLPNSVTIIGDYAFYNCKSLKEISIPNGITSIGNYAFYKCSTLTDITIPNSVTAIGKYAFYNCTSFEEITIPSSVTSIGSNAFYYCFFLDKVNITDISAWCNLNFADEAANPLCYANKLYLNDQLITDLEIPDTVTDIGDYAFYNCSSITSATISDSVVNIGTDTFYNCNKLTSVTIPDSVKSIGAFAFNNCTELNKIYITDITVWCDISFSNCSANPLWNNGKLYLNNEYLYDLTIPNTVTSIADYAFNHCIGLSSITISDGVTNIGNYAFDRCYNISKITIPDSVAKIGNYAFQDCFGLTSLDIPNGITSIGNYAFSGCYNLENINIPSNVKSIGDYAFYYCYGLENVTLSNGITTIGSYAFQKCWNLTSVTIPNSVNKMGTDVFKDCTNLSKLNITDIAAWCRISFSSSNSNPLYQLKNLYLNDKLVTNLIIPDTVTSIGDFAFYGCTSITSVTVPDSITKIGSYAFKNCTNLSKLNISDIAAWCNITFPSCYANPLYYLGNLYLNNKLLTDLIIPDAVATVSDYAFYGCTSITSVTIPKSITKIGTQAFFGCTNLNKVNVTDVAAWCSISFSGNANPLEFAHNLYLNNALITDLVIPDTVESINNHAFNGCTSLKSVKIPDSVTKIGFSAFNGCKRLESIIIPNSITTIDWYTFAYCTELTNITIPRSVKSIGYYAFDNCTSLKTVYYSGTREEWSKINTASSSNPYLTNATLVLLCSCGDKYKEWQTVTAPTFTQDGLEKYVCTVCGTVIDSKVISKLIYGDADRDGSISSSDLATVRKGLLIGITDYSQNMSLDINGDEIIDILDLVRLKKYFSDPENVKLGNADNADI